MDEMNKQIGESEKEKIEPKKVEPKKIEPKKIELNNSPVPVKDEDSIDGLDSINEDSEKLDGSVNEDSINEDSNGTDFEKLDSVNGDSTSDMQTDVPAETEAVEDVSVEDAENSDTEIPSAEKLFTQSQVNDLVGKTRMETREQTYRAIYGRYGVNDEIGMDELVGNAQMYETVRGEYDEAKKGWEETNASRDAELAKVKEHVALLESGIDKSRFDDAKAIIKAKGLEVTAENIQNELATHPEWNGSINSNYNINKEDINPNFRPNPNLKPQTTTSPESTIKVLGNEGNSDTGGMSEEEYAMKKLFKL